jgi:hypothetical protein
MFYALGLVFDGTEGVGSRRHVLRSRTNFRRYRGVPFSIFARTDSFSAVSRALGPVFIFYAPKLIFDGTKGVGYRFHFLHARTHVRRYRGRRIPISCFRSRTRFWRYRGRRVPFPCFSLLDIFSAVPRSLATVFIFCAPRHVFGGTVGVWSRFHVLRARTHFRRYRVRRVPFSCFARSDLYSAVPGLRVPF